MMCGFVLQLDDLMSLCLVAFCPSISKCTYSYMYKMYVVCIATRPYS